MCREEFGQSQSKQKGESVDERREIAATHNRLRHLLLPHEDQGRLSHDDKSDQPVCQPDDGLSKVLKAPGQRGKGGKEESRSLNEQRTQSPPRCERS